jgi:exodeoxyribonuclease-1
MAKQTFFWHDYETFGLDPRRDQATQFAGVRTDLEFNIIGEPINIFCQPADDCLPHPESCLITGITPQMAKQNGVCEAEFISMINQELAQPQTCTLGYNNIRFDDEVTRNLLYRNFYDPYAREWQNGNSRWDLIDVVRATRALRPDGIEWPNNAEGVASFRLEALTQANNIAHLDAHEALSDVYATIAIAKCIKQAQPRLYDFFFQHRIKTKALELLQLGSMKPLLHVSGKYPARKHCLAVVLPIAQHPTNTNGVIVYDLAVDPGPLLELSAEEIQQRVFTATADLPEGVERIPLKTVHINKCPILAPLSVLRKQDSERLEMDMEPSFTHLENIKAADDLQEKLNEVFTTTSLFAEESDPDLMLYGGGFFNHADKAIMAQIRNMAVEDLATLTPDFADPRLPEMLFRYRARNFSETINNKEKEYWHTFCRNKLLLGQDGAEGSALAKYWTLLEEMNSQPNAPTDLLDALAEYAREKMAEFSITEEDLFRINSGPGV